ncbi:MAG: ATP-binding protein [Calothrix sp. MO_167.B42]|nr:ATP-binding protein [Calothrix sp. MO_167.B42]
MEPRDYESRIKQLEKTVRILKKKLERSEVDREQMETASELRESVLKGVIKDLEESQIALEKRGEELESALTNLKTLQVKLVESEKMSALGVMVAGIAHEINNPVNFIYGNLDHAYGYIQDLFGLIQLYQQYYPQPVTAIQEEIEEIELDYIQQDAHKLFESMNMGAERIHQIVQSLRTFSRLDEAEFKLVNIHEGIDSTLVILNNRFQSNPENPQGIKLIQEYGQLPLIECYPGQLNQVFLNILVNAIDALEEGIKHRQMQKIDCLSVPTIRICTELLHQDWVTIVIADNGGGMERQVLQKIFDPFFTTKDVGKGTGLGLSICYQIIVELHGGKLECNSQPKIGTEFVIKIPVVQPQKYIDYNNI